MTGNDSSRAEFADSVEVTVSPPPDVDADTDVTPEIDVNLDTDVDTESDTNSSPDTQTPPSDSSLDDSPFSDSVIDVLPDFPNSDTDIDALNDTAESDTAEVEDTLGPTTEADATPTDTDTPVDTSIDTNTTNTPADAATNAVDETTDTSIDSDDFTTAIEDVFSSVAQVGWYAVGAMLLAILALHLTLLFKYWIPQSVILRRRVSQKGATSHWARLLAIRFYSFTEKLVLVILFAVTMLLAALAAWNNPSTPFATWQEAVAATFSNPWSGLVADKPDGFSAVLWVSLIVLFLIWLVFTMFWLFIPRPRFAKNAPRSALYHIFSVLVPGSGLADEMWGLLLIVPWALVGLDTLSNLLGWGIGLPTLRLSGDYIILGLIYLVNAVAVGVEFSSYRRRMEKLKQNNPELAEEFGLLRSTEL